MGRPMIDETGNRYGSWRIIKFDHRDQRGSILWLCQCDCGATSAVSGVALRRGKTKSCRKCSTTALRGHPAYNKLPPGESGFHDVIRSMKRHAYLAKRQWDITNEEVRTLIESPCFYCGSPPSNVAKHPDHNGEYLYNGVDRLDNNKGYIMSNVVPCCWRCNRAKQGDNYLEFMDWIQRIVNHQSH